MIIFYITVKTAANTKYKKHNFKIFVKMYGKNFKIIFENIEKKYSKLFVFYAETAMSYCCQLKNRLLYNA